MQQQPQQPQQPPQPQQPNLLPSAPSDEDEIVVRSACPRNVTKEALGMGDWHPEVSTPSTLPERRPRTSRGYPVATTP